MVSVGIIVLLLSIRALDNSISGIYDGNSAWGVLNHFSIFAWLLYSATQYQPGQFVVDISPQAYLVLPLFWLLFDGIIIMTFFYWIPSFCARLNGWSRVGAGTLLSVIFVPAVFFGILTFLSNFEWFRMFTDFGIHVYHGLGIDLGGSITEMIRVPFWTFLLSVPNVILLIICFARGKDSSLVRTSFPRT